MDRPPEIAQASATIQEAENKAHIAFQGLVLRSCSVQAWVVGAVDDGVVYRSHHCSYVSISLSSKSPCNERSAKGTDADG